MQSYTCPNCGAPVKWMTTVHFSSVLIADHSSSPMILYLMSQAVVKRIRTMITKNFAPMQK